MAWTWGYSDGAKKGDTNRMSGRSCKFWLPIASLRWRMGQFRRLLKAFDTGCGPLGPEDISWRKHVFQRIQRHPHTARTAQRLLAEFWTMGDLTPYSLDLNLLDFSICRVFQAKVQAMPHTNLDTLCPSPWNGTGKQWNTSARCSFRLCRLAVPEEN